MKINYKDLGFKAGLEIHQQLESHKLFCACPSINDYSVDFEVERQLRASAGETGGYDIAAQYEMAKKKSFVYQFNRKNSCLVELDSEPPHDINKNALKIALEVAKLLNARILPYLEVMRKVVIDGSNTSGFQRSGLLAVNGYIQTSKGDVSIKTICLEEDSAKRITTRNSKDIFHLGRLGVPLVEIATGTEILDSEHAKETAQYLGMILRSTNKVRRGLGTIRQDVNLSIKGSSRVEIKGFQDLRQMPLIIDNEIIRLSSIKNHKAEVRKANEDGTTIFLRPLPGSSRMYPETDIPLIKIDTRLIEEIELPELLTEKAFRIQKVYEISANVAKDLVDSEIDFDYFVSKYGKVKPSIIAGLLIEMPKEVKTRLKLDTNKIKIQDFELILANLNEEKITKDSVFDLLTIVASGERIDFSKFKIINVKEAEDDIKNIVESNKNASTNAVMGIIMKKYKGRIEASKILELIKKYK